MESVILKSENLISKSGFFDTLMLSKFLKQSGFTEQQAEALSQVIKLLQENSVNKKEVSLSKL